MVGVFVAMPEERPTEKAQAVCAQEDHGRIQRARLSGVRTPYRFFVGEIGWGRGEDPLFRGPDARYFNRKRCPRTSNLQPPRSAPTTNLHNYFPLYVPSPVPSSINLKGDYFV